EGINATLGIWLEPNEGAKFWLRVMSELKARGVEDILVFSVDGLKGFPQAIEAVYPQAIVQTCIVHMIRNSLRFTSYKDRKQLVKDLRMIYTAASEEAAQAGLETFAGIWDSRYPQISQSADQPVLARRLGKGDPVLRVPAGAAPRRLHDQPDREPQQRRAQSRPRPRSL